MSSRRIPDWLQEDKTEKYNDEDHKICRPDESSSANTIGNINRRVLRSRSNLETSTTNAKVVSSRQLPFIEYKGSIQYLTESIDIACACDEMISWLGGQNKAKVPIAFDMEWPFSYQTGSGKTSVIQLCADEEICYVFHVSQLKKIPAALVALLTHNKVILHGVNIKNDLRKLQRDFREISNGSVELMIQHCIDLGTWCNEVCNTGGRWSLERLVRYICKLQIDKNKKVRMSKWHIIPLSDAQKLYAAIDVYISQVIYRKLEIMEKEKAERTAAFTETHGEKSLQALKALGFDFLNKDNEI